MTLKQDGMQAIMKSRLLLACIIALLPASTSAFHDGVPPCEVGQVGYWATMLVEGKKMAMFLSNTSPPTSNSIFCNIDPDALVQVKATAGKGL
jgi:hypothetical protein